MGIDEAGDDGPAAQVDHAPTTSGDGLHLPPLPNRDDAALANGNRRGVRTALVQRDHITVEVNDVGELIRF